MRCYRCAIDPAAKVTAGRYEIVSLHPSASSPDGKKLRYMNAAYIADFPPPAPPLNPVPLELARKNGWVLRDGRGRELRHPSWTYNVAVDVGNPDYQQTFVDRAPALLKDYDGIHLDDVNPRSISTAITGAEWAKRMNAFLAVVDALIWPIYANIGWTWDTDAVCRGYLRQLDLNNGVIKEHWVKWGSAGEGYSYEPNGTWDLQVAYVDEAARLGLDVALITTSSTGDTRAATYGLASAMLLEPLPAWTLGGTSYRDETWSAVEERARSLGAPTGARRRNPAGNWLRPFEHGRVAVNPSTSKRGELAPMTARIIRV